MRSSPRPGSAPASLESDAARASVLVASSVSKSYGSVRALAVSGIRIEPGRVHAVVGENGAGKSTLAKLLAGIERPSGGSMTLGGTRYAPRDRADARAAGISMVPQQLSLVGELTLIENLLLTGPRRVADRGAARTRLLATVERVGVQVPLDVPTGRFSQAHRQLGEVIVALAEGARTLILDEPTASLGPIEVGGLFDHLRSLRELGTALVLITHRLDEVRLIADDVTVLSHGKDVHTGSAVGLTPRGIAELMVGELPVPPARATRAIGNVVLRATALTTAASRDAPVRGVDLELRAGEVVGLAGVAGSGQNALIDALAGLVPLTAGAVSMDGVTGSASDLLASGVAWMPEERTEAVVPTMSLSENLRVYSSATGRRRGRGPRGGVPDDVEELRGFDVRPAEPGSIASGLSGGNQQKLLAARELGAAWSPSPPRVVLAYGPTQGLDLRAAQAIRSRLIALAEQGAAVLVASHDLEEVLEIADRVLVMFGGRIVANLPLEDATPQRVGEAMAGIVPATAAPPAHPDTEPMPAGPSAAASRVRKADRP